jgi:hypothetical protein
MYLSPIILRLYFVGCLFNCTCMEKILCFNIYIYVWFFPTKMSGFFQQKDSKCIMSSFYRVILIHVLMTYHLTLFLACFLVIFSRFYIQNRGVLEQLLMISGNLQCFLYLSHVILLFPKHSNSRVFCNS